MNDKEIEVEIRVKDGLLVLVIGNRRVAGPKLLNTAHVVSWQVRESDIIKALSRLGGSDEP